MACSGRTGYGHAGTLRVGRDDDAAGRDLKKRLARGGEGVLAANEGQGVRTGGKREGVVAGYDESPEVGAPCAGRDTAREGTGSGETDDETPGSGPRATARCLSAALSLEPVGDPTLPSRPLWSAESVNGTEATSGCAACWVRPS